MAYNLDGRSIYHLTNVFSTRSDTGVPYLFLYIKGGVSSLTSLTKLLFHVDDREAS
jgi:hypothetical protein